jgi:hypothetical protein
MAKQTINIGASVNDGTGDPLRTAFDKVNDNFDEVYLAGFVGQNLAIDGNTIESTNTNGNIILDPNGTGEVQISSNLTITGNLIPSANLTYDLGNSTNRWNDLYLSGNTIALGSITLKDDGGALAIFAADGTTPASVVVGSIADDSIVNGTSNVAVASSANVTVAVNGSTEATFHSGGLIINDAMVATGNVTGGNIITGGLASVTGNVTGGNLITAGLINATGNVTGGNITTAGVFAGDGSTLTNINGSNIASGTIPSARLSGTYTITVSGSATTAGTVTTAAQPNITSVGTLSTLTVTGDITSASGQFIGDGSALTGITASATAAGADTQVQFNDGGTVTAGDAGFTYNKTTDAVTVVGNINGGNLVTGGSLSLGGTIVTATGTELNYVDGVTSAIQTQLNAKVETLSDLSITSTAAEINKLDGYTGSVTELNYLDTLHATGVTDTEFDYLDGVTSNIQTQLNAKAPTASPTFTTQITTPVIVKSGTNGVGDIGQSANRFGTIYGLATSAQYADLAEIYSSDQAYEPGTVVVLGGESEVTHSTMSHDTAVAGVVSTEPAYLMNSGADGVAVALQGRVPCKVLGPVKKGDLLVTSQHEGVAQKMNKELYEPGCILGKAVEDIQDTTIKIIEILVGRV